MFHAVNWCRTNLRALNMAFCRDTYLVRDDELLPVGRVDVPELRVPELLELPERVLVLELRVLLLVLVLELRELLRAG